MPLKTLFLIFAISANLLLAVVFVESEAQEWSISKTQFGHPDFQGLWINDKRASFERAEELGNRQFYTEEEAQAVMRGFEQRQQKIELPSDPNRGAPPAGELITNIADANFLPDRSSQLLVVNGEYRTSIIIDPPNGRIANLPDSIDYYEQWLAAGYGEFDGPEIRPANERCLNSPGQLPLVNQIAPGDSKTLQIVQTEDYVVLYGEYATSIRIIPLDKEHGEHLWPQWRGNSVGHWEGNNLIINTVKFRPEQSNNRVRSSSQLEVTEVLSMVSENELLYRFTFSDSVMYEKPFTGELILSRMPEGEFLYESACHEGNYAIQGILGGARRQEADKD